ncbi:SGT1 A [Micractinium conductrix]|uniref:SGT1 A n=1 Tax=Micractinium conductrix TaxID=554055 RepID=A0A2P6VBZ9_9CHLO|nr:SGT1 A [Micractinium conductrix]|eukprot:PSC71613.1 SGT1 A [Micractinium conductrix]
MGDVLEAAAAAAKAREYATALDLYSQAIESDPASAAALAARASVHNKMNNHMEAAADASRAAELDDGLAAAHKEKGLACYHLEEFESAMDAFEAAAALEPGKGIHRQWINMCKVQLGEELPPPPTRSYEPPAPAAAPASDAALPGSSSGGGADGKGGISLSGEQLQAFLRAAQSGQLPAALGGAGAGAPPAEEEVGSDKPTHATADDPEFSKYWKAPITAAVAAGLPDKPAGVKYRHQWFQSPDLVEVDVLAKGLKKEQVGVTVEARRLRVATISAEGQEDYCLDLQLHAPVDPERSRFEVLGTKIEIKLQKAEGGRQWPGLEASSSAAAAAAAPAVTAPAAAAAPAAAEATAAEAAPKGPTPVYPYAGKKVDWDKVAEEVEKEEKEEKPEGDQALMKFFRELYEGGDEDTRRAMVKSMQESGGTALSMNWTDVGKKDYSKTDKGDEENEDWGRRRR